MTRVKICCIKNLDEAQLAIRAGASALGLVSEMPSGPGVIEEATIIRVAKQVPPPVASFLLTSRTIADDIVKQQRRTRVNTIQICDDLTAGTYDELRDALPGVSLVQVIHVQDERSIAEAEAAAAGVDAILLDSGNREKAVKELGGTGRTHNWEVSAKIVQSVELPVFLAGGLSPTNVAEAIRKVRPFGVDVCSGVRSDGILDHAKLKRFMQAVRDVDDES